MIRFSPEFVEWWPAVAGLVVGALGWSLALYTRHTARRPIKPEPLAGSSDQGTRP